MILKSHLGKIGMFNLWRACMVSFLWLLFPGTVVFFFPVSLSFQWYLITWYTVVTCYIPFSDKPSYSGQLDCHCKSHIYIYIYIQTIYGICSGNLYRYVQLYTYAYISCSWLYLVYFVDCRPAWISAWMQKVSGSCSTYNVWGPRWRYVCWFIGPRNTIIINHSYIYIYI